MGLPITISEGDFSDPATGVGSTPLAKIAVRFSEAVINEAWAQGNAKSTALDAKMALARAGLPDVATEVAGLDVTAGTSTGASVVEPTITIADASATMVYSEFETQYLELVTLLSDKFADFQTAHFPDDHAFYTQTEDMLQAILANPNGGLPVTVQAQMLADDHARITAEANRASDTLMATFAARRFPLPPGALASGVMQIQQKSQDLMAESSRKITVASIENLKFAIEKAINCRTLAMSTAVEYIKALASGPDMASRLIGVGYDAQSKMINAASSFYGVRAEVAKMSNQVSQYNASTKLEADSKNQMASMALIEANIKTLLTEAQAMAQMATSMFNNLHASAGTTLSI